MSEPSTDEREALLAEHDRQVAERAWDLGNAAGGSRVRRQWSDEPGLPDAENPYRADSLAARPAVDVEGIARVLAQHEWWPISGTCRCGWMETDSTGRHESHQAEAVLAYRAGDSRDR